jgi:hypothetical protein
MTCSSRGSVAGAVAVVLGDGHQRVSVSVRIPDRSVISSEQVQPCRSLLRSSDDRQLTVSAAQELSGGSPVTLSASCAAAKGGTQNMDGARAAHSGINNITRLWQ